MGLYPTRAVERALKIKEVIVRAIAERILWSQAWEIADAMLFPKLIIPTATVT